MEKCITLLRHKSIVLTHVLMNAVNITADNSTIIARITVSIEVALFVV